MRNKATPFQRVDYNTSLRAGRIVTYGEQSLALHQAAQSTKQIAKKVTPLPVIPLSKGKELFNAMISFYKMGLRVQTKMVGTKKFIEAVIFNNETFPVSFSKKMNRVVVWDNSNKKSLTLDQFKAMIAK